MEAVVALIGSLQRRHALLHVCEVHQWSLFCLRSGAVEHPFNVLGSTPRLLTCRRRSIDGWLNRRRSCCWSCRDGSWRIAEIDQVVPSDMLLSDRGRSRGRGLSCCRGLMGRNGVCCRRLLARKNRVYGQNLLSLLLWARVVTTLCQYVLVQCERWIDSHVSVNDPLKLFLALFRTTRAALDGPEKPRLPFNTFASSCLALLALSIFNLGLLVRRKLMVAILYGLSCRCPKLLGFALILLFDRPYQGTAGLRSSGVEEHLLMTGLSLLATRDNCSIIPSIP